MLTKVFRNQILPGITLFGGSGLVRFILWGFDIFIQRLLFSLLDSRYCLVRLLYLIAHLLLKCNFYHILMQVFLLFCLALVLWMNYLLDYILGVLLIHLQMSYLSL